jgi:preprotein translocase subunit SecE
MEKLKNLFAEYYSELANHVTWPKAEELQANAVTVLIASMILASIIALIDFSFNGLLQLIYSLFQ